MSEEITAGGRKIVVFSLNERMFGIDMQTLIEIREWSVPTPLPGVPPYVLGVTNLRGTVVPVIGLSQRLGWTPSEIHQRSCLLIVNIGGKQAGFLVDEVADIVSVNDADIQAPPDIDIGEPDVITGLVRIGGSREGDTNEMVLLLEMAALGITKSMDMAA